MPARDFSVMPVKLLPDERVSLMRAVRSSKASTRAGDIVEVEFGATWATKRGETFKVPGVWYQCVIVRVVHSELEVRLSPDPQTAPSELG